LCTLLEQQAGWLVVGEVDSADNLIPQIKDTTPDLILLKWGLPELNAPQLIPVLREEFTNISIIVLSGRPEHCSEALAMGADAFVCKANPPDGLLQTISSVYQNLEC
jgi:DNA-binding NarL/FixJ family response regulator